MLAGPDIVAITLRTVSFVADFQAAGIAMFLVFYADKLANSISAIRSLGIAAAVVGILFTLAHYLSEPGRMAGNMAGVFDGALQTMLLATNVATTASIRVLGLVLITIGLLQTNKAGQGISLIGATLVIVSFAFIGHTAAHDLRWLLVILLISHLAIVAMWFGALLPLILASRREQGDALSSVIELFSVSATWLVPLILIVGVLMSIILIEHLDDLWSAYGYSVLLKTAGFALLMALATLNKWRLGPSIAAGSSAAITAFRRSAATEWVLIVAVLATTATMTSLYSPIH